MPVEFRHQTLPNGLDVIAECDDEAHTAAVGFFVRTGARDERPQLMGVSHFLEHMMFKGTQRRSAEDVNREFDELGAHTERSGKDTDGFLISVNDDLLILEKRIGGGSMTIEFKRSRVESVEPL